MNFRLLLIALTLIIPALPIFAQSRIVHPDGRPTGEIFRKIDDAFEEGQLTLEQKVLYKFYAGKSPSKLPPRFRRQTNAPLKCGTPALIDFQQHREKLSSPTTLEIESLIHPPSLQAAETYRSPSGHFTIHYETSGPDAVPAADRNGNGTPDYAEWVAAAADSSYRHEVQNLGYTDPFLKNPQPYQIYILDLRFYGETVSDGNTSYIKIENDFSENFPPNTDPEGDQAGAVKATMAHELKHAIQYAATGWKGETDRWAEMDATLMEEVVYDNVNDYYNYLGNSDSIFNNPQTSFYPGTYYHVTWALFFEEKFGPDFWPSVWEAIEHNPQITMVDALTGQLGSEQAFRKNYVESHLWHFAAGSENSAADYGFDERENYPDPSSEQNNEFYTKDFSVPRSFPSPGLSRFSARYFRFSPPAEVTGNVALEIQSFGEAMGAGVIAYFSDGTAGTASYALSEGESTFQMPQWEWSSIDKIGIILTNASTATARDASLLAISGSNFNDELVLSQNYPNPFNPETNIRFTLDRASHVKLKIYDTSGRLVQTLYDRELEPGLHETTFNGRNLAAGIYFYQLTTDHQTLVKKMTLVK